MATNLIYDVEDKPKFRKLLAFALQQVLAIMAATIAVPTIIGLKVEIPAAILGAGLGTLTYLCFTKFKSPVCISSSFAFLSALGNAMAFGYFGIVLGSIFAGLVYVVIAIVVKFTGTGWVKKLLPPVIIGPTVAIIGISLAGNAVGDLVKANADPINGGYNLVGLFCGLVTFFTVVVCSMQNKYKGVKLLPFIIGIGVGYGVASLFSIFGYVFDANYLKIVDWSPIVNNFKTITVESFVTYPRIALVEAIKELASGNVSEAILAVNPNATTITGVGVAEVAIAFIPVAMVVFAEHIADHHNLGTIIGRHLLDGEPGMSRTLLGDGVGSIVGTCFGICPNTTYGESIACVAITKNASVRTILMAAVMCVGLSFLTPLMTVLQSIPSCVMGGVCLTLYGFISVSGLKMFKDVDMSETKNLFTISAILIAGIGGFVLKFPYAFNETTEYVKYLDANGVEQIAYDANGNALVAVAAGSVAKVIQVTSIAAALILGIVTNLVCKKVNGTTKIIEKVE